jgi:putative DNA primase/helicase
MTDVADAPLVELVHVALAYAARGWPVLPLHTPHDDGSCDCGRAPCASPGKHPRTRHGLRDASTDPSQIQRWWSTWPHANMGVRTGAASGLVVLDVDVRHDGDLTLRRLVQYHGALPPTVAVVTGSGGRHLYFALPDAVPVRNSAGRLGPGLDIRAEGGYVVACPSLHVSGRRYAWEPGCHPDEMPVATLPGWLRERLVAPPEQRNDHVERGTGQANTLAIGRVPVIEGRIPEGERSATLTSLGGTMRHRGISPEAIAAALQVENTTRCDPPLPETEVATIAASVGRYAPEALSAWDDLRPLPPERPGVPELPEGLVPPPLRPWLVDAATRTSVPLCYLAVPAVVALSSVVGRSLGIYPKRFDDWLVVPNLWGYLVGRPGILKTACVQEATRPLRRLEAEAWEQFEAELAEAQAYQVELEVRIAQLKKEMGKKGANLDGLKDELADLLREQKEAVPRPRRYSTSDPTVEKLTELLRDNPRGLLLLRDELAGFLRMLSKPGREGDRQIYLEAWNGTGSYTTDRIARGTVRAPLTVALLGGITPGRLAAYVETATGERHRGTDDADDGLIQRGQLAVWPDAVGEFHNVDRWPNHDARELAYTIFARLDTMTPRDLGADITGEIPALRFAPDAQELFDAWRTDLERRLRAPAMEAMPAFESHLAKYRSLMPSLALIFHLVSFVSTGRAEVESSAEEAGDAAGAAVSLDSARLAAAWCEFLEAHARKIYAAETSAGPLAARALAEKITSGAVDDGIPVRVIARAQWTGLAAPGSVQAAIATLTGLGWCRVEAELPDGRGRAAHVLRLNPRVRAGVG